MREESKDFDLFNGGIAARNDRLVTGIRRARNKNCLVSRIDVDFLDCPLDKATANAALDMDNIPLAGHDVGVADIKKNDPVAIYNSAQVHRVPYDV